ncbi:hypothetical protein MKUB_49820 [Mycobacterium kubicae]|uniref:Twin-arginine translocation pathway signal n=1 Tax=Mycobacterium kubicae TaxID=120959 RepID=A0AAX1J568_9MYCO|nr:hypothetical protein [Mycobacterium kubicae]MCV7094691.1 hypothetical protein [Mycobacterium kubicae]ORV97659.1 hypothetical protein AWC13_15600 [Mycobacterium kubicae]QNI13030.1 hypothetical protein GAN18_19270 [Mycobacterium kubicae]QPI36546.1 hypothetical protein I2456_18960 [Mycobacterium kubicae]GFG67492.1 hypothetical protein MKUB_49820 [Mycobacterium kubicae]
MSDDARRFDTAETADTPETAGIDPLTGVKVSHPPVEEAGADADDQTVVFYSDADFADDVEEDPDSAAEPARNWRRDLWRKKINVRPIPLILVVLLLISSGVAAWLYVSQYRPAKQTDPDVERAAVTAASDGTVALLSYSPDSLDKDFANAKSHLAGDFLSYYEQFTQQTVAPAAKQKSLKTSAHVMRAAVSELRANSAVVLLFVDQSTTSKDNPEPSVAASSVLVDLSLIDGKWLITKFTPL